MNSKLQKKVHVDDEFMVEHQICLHGFAKQNYNDIASGVP
jgi:hypothetical protein